MSHNDLSAQDMEKIAADFDSSIRAYEEYYRQQESVYCGSSPEYSQEYQGYNVSPHIQELSYIYDQALSEYEETLDSIEQSLDDFNEAISYIDSLEQKQQEQYIREWEEYLRDTLDTARQLAGSLEETIRNISGEIQG
ncbi:MAG: hypothetical protein GXP46_04870 [Deferribacteres bacterium]|nr:hypothetical protein [Deferribacteres bacterium]